MDGCDQVQALCAGTALASGATRLAARATRLLANLWQEEAVLDWVVEVSVNCDSQIHLYEETFSVTSVKRPVLTNAVLKALLATPGSLHLSILGSHLLAHLTRAGGRADQAEKVKVLLLDFTAKTLLPSRVK